MTKKELADQYSLYAWECDEAAHVIPHGAALKVMDEYAKQQGAAFVKWMDVDAVRDGDDLWVWRGDNFKVRYNTDQLYDKFIEQQNKP